MTPYLLRRIVVLVPILVVISGLIFSI